MLRKVMVKQVVQRRQRREGDSRSNCQIGVLHQIIKVIGHGIIHILCLCLCGIHLLVCMVIPQLLILILGMNLYVMDSCQIILLIDDQELEYLFRLCILLWMNSYGRYFDIALSVKIQSMNACNHRAIRKTLMEFTLMAFRPRGIIYTF